MEKPKVEIRTILKQDNTRLAEIIRKTLTEFGADKPGTVFYDKSTDRLSEVFAITGSEYFVLCMDGEIAGGAGIYPSPGLPPDTCELVKMYLLPHARGHGLGYRLLKRCTDSAIEKGYHRMYLETMPELSLAITLYEKSGFKRLPSPLGNTGHTGCGIWMIRDVGVDADSPG